MWRVLFTAVIASSVFLLNGVQARPDIIGTVDENGNGTSFNTSTGVTATFTGQNGVDPFDPANGLKPLIYDIGNASFVNGDLLVIDPGSGMISDIDRFFSNTATGRDLLIIYSQINTSGGNALADVGIPGTLQTNTLSLTETGPAGGPNGIFNYKPTSSQPGYFAIPPSLGSGNVVYNLNSDTASVVPEPGSIMLLGAGLAVVLASRRLICRPV
jgi:hypothetical protein